MKKFLVFLVLIVMLFSLCACNYVPSTRFMSRAKVDSLVKQFGTPQAVVTISYKIGDKEHKIEILYDLLLSQTPLAVIQFIHLANDGFYNDTVIDTYDSQYHYMILGRYSYDAESKKFYDNISTVTFKGEFASNNYREPKEGFAQFKMFSLAMYYDNPNKEDGANFDKANGTLLLELSEKEPINYKNHAVFAHMVSVAYDGGEPSSKVTSTVLGHLTKGSTSNNVVYSDKSESSSRKEKMPSPTFTIQVKIVGAKGKSSDWSKLPRIGQ